MAGFLEQQRALFQFVMCPVDEAHTSEQLADVQKEAVAEWN